MPRKLWVSPGYSTSSVGVSPIMRTKFAEALEATYDITVPREPGLDTYESMCAAERGAIDAALFLGGNLFASNPDRACGK